MRCTLLTPMETEMSNNDKDRKVSKPTEADFIRGFAHSAAGKATGASLLAGLAISFIVGKAPGRKAGK